MTISGNQIRKRWGRGSKSVELLHWDSGDVAAVALEKLLSCPGPGQPSTAPPAEVRSGGGGLVTWTQWGGRVASMLQALGEATANKRIRRKEKEHSLRGCAKPQRHWDPSTNGTPQGTQDASNVTAASGGSAEHPSLQGRLSAQTA